MQDKIFFFKCKTFQERDSWIYALIKAIEGARYNENRMGNFFN